MTPKDIQLIHKPNWSATTVQATFDFIKAEPCNPVFAPNQYLVIHKATGARGFLTLQQGIFHSFDPVNS